LACATLVAGIALVAVTLGVDGFAGRNGSREMSAAICRSCAIFAQTEARVTSALDPGNAAAFTAGIAPWRRTCESEGDQCRALFSSAGSADRCQAFTRDWATLETRFAAGLRAVSKLSVTCAALSCPVLSCSPAISTLHDLSAGGDAARLLMLLSAQARPSRSDAFASASATLNKGRKALAGLTAVLGGTLSDFGGEWAYWQNFARELDDAGDDLLMRGDIAQSGRVLFSSAADASRAMAVGLERMGGEDTSAQDWTRLGDAIGAFLVASTRIDEVIAHAVTPLRFEACGSDIGDRARRLETTMTQLEADLAQCVVRAQCARAADGTDSASGPRTSLPGAAIQRLERAAEALALNVTGTSVSEAPAASLTLKYPSYAPREPIQIAIEPRGNRCLAAGGAVELTSAGHDSAAVEARGEFPYAERSAVVLAAPDAPGPYIASLLPAREGRNTPPGPVPLAQVPFAIESVPQGCEGFAGTWETDFGVMTAVIRGDHLLGSYRRAGASRPGIVEGTIRGREMKGTWSSDLGSGGARLILLEGGQRFSGTWGDTVGEVDGAGLWRGHCVQPGPAD